MSTPEKQYRVVGTLGWREFLALKHDMLYRYELAKVYNRAHIVRTSHGNVAEACLRECLSQFLPKRFGVTSGCIISQGQPDTAKTPHFDVVIYDQLESPILWTDANPDRSESGLVRAIPAEHVYGVIEVKSAFDRQTVAEAMKQLSKLIPLMKHVEHPAQRYRECLPQHFCCGIVAFELRKEDAKRLETLQILVPPADLRGFMGGLILKGEGRPADETGLIMSPILDSNHVGNDPAGSDSSLLNTLVESERVTTELGEVVFAHLSWTHHSFSSFMWGLLQRMKGTHDPRLLPSRHGFAWLEEVHLDGGTNSNAEEAPS